MERDCVFCDRTKFDERLLYEKNDWYVVATLGQIIGGYVLIIPKAHIACMGALTSHDGNGQTEEMLKITAKVCRALSLEYRHDTSSISCSVLVFEHGIIGQTITHAHLHLMPAAIDLTQKVQADFPESKFEELGHATHLQELYHERLEPYLFWTVPNGKAMVCWNPQAPPLYLRLMAAKLLGYPERGNWRNMDPELDKRLRQETIDRLNPYLS